MKSVKEENLQTFFRKKASKRFQFAIELSEEIGFLKEAYSSYGPFSPLKRINSLSSEENLISLLKKSIKKDKKILKDYKQAMSVINEGSTREILLRHMSIIEKSILELKTLKAASQEVAQENPDIKAHI
jgi:bacterioferritin (cytochrome b1)